MKRSRLLYILGGMLLCALLFAALLFVGSALKKETVSRNRAPQSTQSEIASGNKMENAPFLLEITSSEIGAKDYISFHVYFKNEYSDELVFTCGRMFGEDEFKSVAWNSTGYDIIVTLTNDQTVRYVFDGNNNWQETD